VGVGASQEIQRKHSKKNGDEVSQPFDIKCSHKAGLLKVPF
jgi:hypothetical protein